MDDVDSETSHWATTVNIKFLENNIFKFQYDEKLRVPRPDDQRYQRAVSAVAEEVQLQRDTSASPKERKEKRRTEDFNVKRTVGKILRCALDIADPFDERGAQLLLLRDCALPLVDRNTKAQPLALPFHFPIQGNADFGIGIAPPNSSRAAKHSRPDWEWENTSNYRSLGLPVASMIKVKADSNIDVETCTASELPKHNEAITQAALYTLYSMMGILTQLSETEKRQVFGDNIEMYGLVMSHKSAFVLKVTPTGFRHNGKFTVTWSTLLRTDEYFQTIASFVFESIRLLRQVQCLVPTPFPKPPRFCWLPADEYKLKFPFLQGEPIISYTQTFTNPIIKIGKFYCRIYRSHFSKTQYSRLCNIDVELTTLASTKLFTRFRKLNEAVLKNAPQTEILALVMEPLPQNPVNPFKNWILSEPLMVLPDYGPSLHNRLHPTPPVLTPNITFRMIKNLVLSVYRNSIESLVATNYCHMDIRLPNICTSQDDWSDAHLIDYDFCTVSSERKDNPMSKSRLQYPPDEKVVPSSDVWMFGYVLARLGEKLNGVELVRDEAVKTHIALEEWIQTELDLSEVALSKCSESCLVEDIRVLELKVKFLQVVAGCLKLQPDARLTFAQIVEQVNEWVC